MFNAFSYICIHFQIYYHNKIHQLLPYENKKTNPTFGSADICLLIERDLNKVKEELESKRISIEEGIVRRNGFCGPIDSIYLRDPDGNLIELNIPILKEISVSSGSID